MLYLPKSRMEQSVVSNADIISRPRSKLERACLKMVDNELFSKQSKVVKTIELLKPLF